MDNVMFGSLGEVSFADMSASDQAAFEAMTSEQRAFALNPPQASDHSDFANMSAAQQAAFEAQSGAPNSNWMLLGVVLVGLAVISGGGGKRR